MRRVFLQVVLTSFLVLGLDSTMHGQSWGPTSFFELTADLDARSVPRIQEHLSFMVDYLRAQDVSGLSPDRRRNRARHIERLDVYWQEGVFPRNESVSGFAPIFIDQGGRACAVADLMIHSGARSLAECVAENENTAYVRDIREPGVVRWIEESGLTAEECAMIQPAYFCGKLINFTCTSDGDDVILSWEYPGPVDFLFIERDGVSIYFNYDDPTEYVDADLPPGVYSYSVYAELSLTCYYIGECLHAHNTSEFSRGDVDGDGGLGGLADTLYVLNYGFAGGPPPPCMEAADADGNGTLNALVDGLYVFNHVFSGGPPPPPPYPNCGPDVEVSSSLGCLQAPSDCP